MQSALQQRVSRVRASLNQLRDDLADRDQLREVEAEFAKILDRIGTIDDEVEDQSQLALREVGRALDELNDRIDDLAQR